MKKITKKKILPPLIKEIQNNPPPKVDYSYQKNISFSQLSIYHSCPHRWKLQYKDKIRISSENIHLVFGTAIHETIQEYLQVMYDKSKVAANKLHLEFRFQKKFIEEYQKRYKKHKSHFSDAAEMREFFEDGVSILEYFKKNIGKYFSKRNDYLVGCEVPLNIAVKPSLSNLRFISYLDLVTYNYNTQEYTIYDIKTSTKSWNDYKKKDDLVRAQLLLYKQKFSEQYGVPLDKINIEFFIVKRKLNSWLEEEGYGQSRIQRFIPPSGKNSLNKAKKLFEGFLEECFDKKGNFKEGEYKPKPNEWTCKFCPFSHTKHCNKSQAPVK